jgi:hypothetical protein
VSTEPTHLFYGDFNCPFCYALSEQLHDLGLESLVSFRAVQHLLTPGEWARETPQSLVDEVREQGFGPIGESPVLRLAARAWQDGWQSGGFDRRIPVLVAPGGARSMGLEESRRTATFLRAGLISSDSGDTCGGNARLGRF